MTLPNLSTVQSADSHRRIATTVNALIAQSGSGSVATRTDLATASTTSAVYLTEAGREGDFVFDGSDLSAEVTADPAQGVYVAPSSDATGASGAWVRKDSGAPNAKWFGAVGDGSTDDTAAIQAAIDYVYAEGGGTLFFPAGTYIVAGALQDTGLSNSQIVLPKVTDMAEGRVIHLLGPTGAGTTFASESGAILKSTLTTGSGSMIGCQTSVGCSRISFYAENITFRMVENPTNSCLDLRYLPMHQLTNVRVDVPSIAAGTDGSPFFDVAEPTTTTSCGILGPLNNIPTWANINNVVIAGYYTGIWTGELVGGDNLAIFACKLAVKVGNSLHPMVYGRILVCNCQAALQADPFISVNTSIYIRMLDIEHDTDAGSGPSWVEPIGYDIDDQYNSLQGIVYTHNHEDTAPFTKNGAKNLRIEHIRTGNSNDAPYLASFPGMGSVTEASCVRGLRPRITDAILYDQLVGQQTSTTGVVAAWHAVNESAPGSDYRIGGFAVVQDGALTAGKMLISTANSGAMTDQVEINSAGDVRLLQNTQHLVQSAQGAIAGIVTMPSGTSFTFSWPRAFNSVPAVVLTPCFDLGSGVRFWYTGTASQCTINASSAVAGQWVYHVTGAPD